MSQFEKGELVAVMGVLNREQVMRIARVVEDHGDRVDLLTDEQIEGEAAIEHDFATPEQVEMTVAPERLRRIKEER